MTTKQYKVLIVDDSKSILYALEHAFKATPFAVQTINNPIQAYKIIEEQHIDIVISDIEMPDMNGLELLKKIKSHNGMIQVIIMTGYITVNNTLNAFRYGAADLFFKPVDPDHIIDATATAAAKLDRVRHLLARAVAPKGETNG